MFLQLMFEADEVGFFAFGVVVSGHLNLYPVMKGQLKRVKDK